jgi:uncharacterized protein YaaQ
MKLIFIILGDENGDEALQLLVEKGYRVTRVASTGGFLRRGNVTLMTGVQDSKVKEVINMIRQTCDPSGATHRRATLFVVDMPYFEQI